MKFKGKQDLWLSVLIWSAVVLGFGASILPIIDGEQSFILYGLLIVSGLFLIFISWIYKVNYVVLEDTYMVVRFGPFKEKYDYSVLTKVEETRLPLSSLALSLDRLALYKNQSFKSLISVKDKELFLKELAKRSQHTTIIRKNK